MICAKSHKKHKQNKIQQVQQEALSFISPRENIIIAHITLIVNARHATLLILSLLITFLRAAVIAMLPRRSPAKNQSIFFYISLLIIINQIRSLVILFNKHMELEEQQIDQICKEQALLEVEKFKKEINIFLHNEGDSLQLLKEKTMFLLFGLNEENTPKYSTKEINPFNYVSYPIDNPTQSQICSKNIILCKDGVGYRCFDCMECDSSILCEACFVAGNHHNHRFRRLQKRTGCCDCGDVQVWNQKGFCTQHRGQNKISKIDDKLIARFIADFKFAFFVYFWLYHRSKQEDNNQIQPTQEMKITFGAYRKKYGNFLFDFLLQFADQSIESKTLCHLLLSQRIQSQLVNSLNQTILQQIFKIETINSDGQLTKFTQLLNSLPSISAHKQQVLKIYFEETFRHEFPCTHPMRKINFQYLTSVKMMNSMIVAGQLRPLQLDSTKKVTKLQHLQNCFKKLYEDMHYINKMKAKQEFQTLHFQRTNIAEMAFYRKYTQIDIYVEDFIINIDHLFLKTLGYMISSIRKNKPLLEKGIRELTAYIINHHRSKVNTLSLAQQRALALYLIAYYDGNIHRLADKKEADYLLKLFNFDLSKKTIEKVLYKFVSCSLVSIVYSSIVNQSQKQRKNVFEEWFFTVHSESNFLMFLDIIYCKCLLLISKHYMQFGQVVEQTFSLIVERICPVPSKIHEIQKFAKLLCFLGTIQLDELAISIYLKCSENERVFKFYKQLRATYVYLNPKQFKAIAISILNNSTLFDTFMLDHPELVQGRKVEGDQEEALPTILYKGLATKDDVLLEKVHFLRSNPILPCYKDINFFNIYSIQLVIEALQELNKNPEYSRMEQIEHILKQSLNSSLVLIYLATKNQKIKEYFDKSTNQYKQYFDALPQALREQINIVFNSQAQQKQQKERSKELQLKKKEKMQAKKKEKESAMKKQQLQFLKAYQQKEVTLTQQDFCIFCKQQNGEILCYIAHCNLTNLLQQRIFQQNTCHIFFTICGHKIHSQCFNDNISKNQITKCILCRKESNFNIPILAHQAGNKEDQVLIVEQFIQNLYLILLQFNENRQEVLQNLYGNECDYNVVYMLLISVAKEIFMLGIHTLKFAKSKMQPIFSQILQILKLLPKQQLKCAFDIKKTHREKMNQEQTQNQEIISIIMEELQLYLFEEQENKMEDNQINPGKIIKEKVRKIFKFIMGSSITQEELQSFTFFDKKKFLISLPETITNFTNYSGQCSFCKIYTNWMYICMICGWKACSHESKAFKKHTLKQHYSGSIFICSYNGNIAYFFDGRVHNDHSMYPNYLGEDYHEIGSSIIDNQVTDTYRLNREKFNEVERIMIENEIPNYARRV